MYPVSGFSGQDCGRSKEDCYAPFVLFGSGNVTKCNFSEEKDKFESGKAVKTSAKFIILSPIDFLPFSATNIFLV